MVALKNILVASDFSACSDAALAEARRYADAFDARIHLLHVVTEPLHEPWAGYAPEGAFLETINDLEIEARGRLHRTIAGWPDAGRFVIDCVWGDPSEQIVKYAREDGIDLIVCGTHGRSGFDHALVGSVAERVVRLAPCPVLTVHAAPHAESAVA